MSDTPRTDALYRDHVINDLDDAGNLVWLEYSRQLERELAAMTARAEANAQARDELIRATQTLLDRLTAAEAELSRLTTLRPASEYDNKKRVVVHWKDGYSEIHGGDFRWRPELRGWTPIPTPKGAK